MSQWPQIVLLVVIALELWSVAACEAARVVHPPFSTLGYAIRMGGFLSLLYLGGFFHG